MEKMVFGAAYELGVKRRERRVKPSLNNSETCETKMEEMFFR